MKSSSKILLAVTAAAALSVAYPAKANLISNLGFETGDFTGWSVSGPASVEGTVGSIAPHSGNFQAQLGSFGSIGQTLATTAGPILHDRLLGGQPRYLERFRRLGWLQRFRPYFCGANWLHRVEGSAVDRLEHFYVTSYHAGNRARHLVPRRRQREPDCSRWRLNSFSPRLCFTRLGWLVAQIALLSPIS